MPKYSALLPLSLLLATAPGLAGAQVAELVTDRPDFTESATAVPRGSVQVEMGSTWERAQGTDAVSGAEALVRWGVSDVFELRFGLPNYARVYGDWARSDGSLGIKLPLPGLGLGAWDLALIESVWLQVGNGVDDSSVGEMILTAGRAIGDRASFGSQISAAGAGSGGGRVDLGATAVIGLALGERLSTFTELAVDALEDRRRAVVFHHGYSWLVTPLLQLDFHVALGLNETAPDAQIGLGLGTRLGG